MKAIILAGGTGTRLYPVTQVVNKHLLTIYNKPMIYYPLSVVMLAGIREVAIVINPQDKEAFQTLLGDGSHLGMKIEYITQSKPGGIAEGLIISRNFIGEENILYMLGDNVLYGHGLPELMRKVIETINKEKGAAILCYSVPDPKRFGIAEIDRDGRVLSIEEKPSKPKSNLAVIGVYIYDNEVVKIAQNIKPSRRGELEITSVNREYLKMRKLKAFIMGRGFAWFDAGTHSSFLEASNFVATIESKTGYMIGCIEEVAYKNGWINKTQLMNIAKKQKNSDYGKYLLKLAKEKSDVI